ncbi:glycoside hydrolase, partial [Thelephora ganbajun]
RGLCFRRYRYWGQNSRGAARPDDSASYQRSISYYCRGNSTDIIQIAFLTKFFSTGGLPEINLGNSCNNLQNGTFPGTSLSNCKKLASDIKTCQAKGKLVTLSLGGALGDVLFSGDKQAKHFADTLWDLFLGGSSHTRPFGSAVLDGIDLDTEAGSSTGYAAFAHRIRTLSTGASKKYYVAAAPQCTYPDETLSGVLNTTWFDALYVQFYNNPCGLQNFNGTSYWNFGLWDYWARHVSPNRNIKVYIGAPAASVNGTTRYVPVWTLSSIAVEMRRSYPSFGGVMLWDASQAYANGRYDLSVKEALIEVGGVGFTYPQRLAYAYVSGQAYTSEQVLYIWEAKWWTETVPKHDPLGQWNEGEFSPVSPDAPSPTLLIVFFAVSACRGIPPVRPTSSALVLPGIPTGALSNGGNGVYERAYFRNVRLRLETFFCSAVYICIGTIDHGSFSL